MPWSDKTGLAKWAAMFAMLTLVSFGLCGMNFVAVIRFVPLDGGAAPPSWRDILGSVLSATGVIELIGIAVGIAGLIGVGLQALLATRRRNKEDAREE